MASGVQPQGQKGRLLYLPSGPEQPPLSHRPAGAPGLKLVRQVRSSCSRVTWEPIPHHSIMVALRLKCSEVPKFLAGIWMHGWAGRTAATAQGVLPPMGGDTSLDIFRMHEHNVLHVIRVMSGWHFTCTKVTWVLGGI